jgi:hypothetical protein
VREFVRSLNCTESVRRMRIAREFVPGSLHCTELVLKLVPNCTEEVGWAAVKLGFGSEVVVQEEFESRSPETGQGEVPGLVLAG